MQYEATAERALQVSIDIDRHVPPPKEYSSSDLTRLASCAPLLTMKGTIQDGK